MFYTQFRFSPWFHLQCQSKMIYVPNHTKHHVRWIWLHLVPLYNEKNHADVNGDSAYTLTSRSYFLQVLTNQVACKKWVLFLWIYFSMLYLRYRRSKPAHTWAHQNQRLNIVLSYTWDITGGETKSAYLIHTPSQRIVMCYFYNLETIYMTYKVISFSVLCSKTMCVKYCSEKVQIGSYVSQQKRWKQKYIQMHQPNHFPKFSCFPKYSEHKPKWLARLQRFEPDLHSKHCR